MSWILILLLALSCVHLEWSSEHHSLEFLYGAPLEPNGHPRIHHMIVFDGIVVFSCDDDRQGDHPGQAWTKQMFDLKKENYCKSQYSRQLGQMKDLQNKISNAAGFVQRRRGCTGNRSEVTSFDKWGLNGDDFLTFNTTTQTWEPDSELAAPVASNWNQNSYWNLVDGEFSQNWCRKILHVFVEKKVAGRKHPETDVLDKETITVWNWTKVVVIVVVGLVLVLCLFFACYIRRNERCQELIRDPRLKNHGRWGREHLFQHTGCFLLHSVGLLLHLLCGPL
ncbi:uncharacterized protein LOC114797442 isoform X2 [Denticeps clupeoides]|uniref:uncharacterized protein LOC114797442 isoform X2 n=1 Tax=Denticeps clupeoides TaxID=299321 RepID=UPI0010A383AD|nr:uncharacterized protein LOC114797442 isoform X2 [Denticeps clupeoides]